MARISVFSPVPDRTSKPISLSRDLLLFSHKSKVTKGCEKESSALLKILFDSDLAGFVFPAYFSWIEIFVDIVSSWFGKRCVVEERNDTVMKRITDLMVIPPRTWPNTPFHFVTYLFYLHSPRWHASLPEKYQNIMKVLYLIRGTLPPHALLLILKLHTVGISLILKKYKIKASFLGRPHCFICVVISLWWIYLPPNPVYCIHCMYIECCLLKWNSVTLQPTLCSMLSPSGFTKKSCRTPLPKSDRFVWPNIL